MPIIAQGKLIFNSDGAKTQRKNKSAVLVCPIIKEISYKKYLFK